jgi:hypothetical protein
MKIKNENIRKNFVSEMSLKVTVSSDLTTKPASWKSTARDNLVVISSLFGNTYFQSSLNDLYKSWDIEETLCYLFIWYISRGRSLFHERY